MVHSLTGLYDSNKPGRAVYLRNCLHFRSHYQHPVHEVTSCFTSGPSVQIGHKNTLSLCHRNTGWVSVHTRQHPGYSHGLWSFKLYVSTLIFLFVQTRDVASKQLIQVFELHIVAEMVRSDYHKPGHRYDHAYRVMDCVFHVLSKHCIPDIIKNRISLKTRIPVHI